MSKLRTLERAGPSVVKNLIDQGYSTSTILRIMLQDSKSANDPRLRKYITDIRATHSPTLVKSKRRFCVNELKAAVANATCMSDVLRAVGLQPHGGNSASVKKLIVSEGIDISHFNPSAAMRRNKKEWTYEEIFCKDSKLARPSLSKHVRKFNLFPYECVSCGNRGEWLGKPLGLTVDHKDGINDNNIIENLCYLCPNCHAQTDTFGGRNK